MAFVAAPPIAALYLRTLVLIEDGGVLVPAEASRLAADGVVHVITAWNPGPERPGPDANDAANGRLRGHLVARGCEPVRALGCDPDSDHAEESWAVRGMTDEDARALGAAYGQVAVFRIADGVQTVLACADTWEVSRRLGAESG